jgi:hypothetical protein
VLKKVSEPAEWDTPQIPREPPMSGRGSRAALTWSKRRADLMHNPVGVGIDKLAKTVRRVVRAHEPTFNTC